MVGEGRIRGGVQRTLRGSQGEGRMMVEWWGRVEGENNG